MYLKPYCESLDYLVSLTHLLHLLSTGLVQLEWTSIVYVPTVIPIVLGGEEDCHQNNRMKSDALVVIEYVMIFINSTVTLGYLSLAC